LWAAHKFDELSKNGVVSSVCCIDFDPKGCAILFEDNGRVSRIFASLMHPDLLHVFRISNP
jgi:hypothetical protein